MNAHRAFGARTGGAPLAMGAVLVALALMLGAGLAALLAAFPVAVLAGMLAVAGLLHVGLLGDLTGAWGWAIALLVGIAGILTNLAVALALGLALWWGRALSRRARQPQAARRGGPAPSSAAPRR
jgi:SulP family sulfate permease